jgi:hypothetical protein
MTLSAVDDFDSSAHLLLDTLKVWDWYNWSCLFKTQYSGFSENLKGLYVCLSSRSQEDTDSS